MGLLVNIAGTTQEVVVDNTHPVFSDTKFADVGFKVVARTLKDVQSARFEKEALKISTKRGQGIEYDTDKLLVNRFCAMVQSWQGFEQQDPSGKITSLPCNDETKKALATNDRALARLIVTAIDEQADEMRVTRVQELGNSQSPGAGA